MRFRRGSRFDEVIDRQLDLFEADRSTDLEAIATALDAYNRAPADEAEERYSEYADLVDSFSQELEGMSVHFAKTQENDPGSEYLAVFARRARQRFRDLPLDLA